MPVPTTAHVLTFPPRPVKTVCPPTRVLLADADGDTRALYLLALTHAGFRVRTAASAADAFDIAQCWTPDIVVTELYVAEVFVPANCTITGVAPFFGANTNGNAKVMLFDSAGTRVAISASTDVSGFTADAYARIAFSAPYAAVGPATYYVGIICDDNSNDLNTHVVGNFGAGKIESLVYGTEAGYATITVPTTFTTGLGPIASSSHAESMHLLELLAVRSRHCERDHDRALRAPLQWDPQRGTAIRAGVQLVFLVVPTFPP